MCTYVYVRFVIGFVFFLYTLGTLGLIIVRYFPKKCGNVALPQWSGKDTVLNTNNLLKV